jgi:hypothetical protein
LDGKVQNRLLVFVLKQPVDDQGMVRIPSLDQVPWNSLDTQLNPRAHLDAILSPSLFRSTSSSLVILKLEDLGVIERKVFVRIPRRCPETL